MVVNVGFLAMDLRWECSVVLPWISKKHSVESPCTFCGKAMVMVFCWNCH